MLAISNSTKAPALKVGHLDDAPWYEILLFKTRLRFRNPKATTVIPDDLYGRPTDLRPFLNTASKQDYGPQGAGKLPRSINIYHNRWAFSTRRWFARPSATLEFRLNAIALTEADEARYPDLYQPRIGSQWVTHNYLRQIAFQNQFAITKLDSGDYELHISNGNAGGALLDNNQLPIKTLSVNGNIAYHIAPSANQLDYLVPFTKTDILLFSFTLTSTTLLSHVVRRNILQQASELANSVMQTVVLEYPNRNLTSA